MTTTNPHQRQAPAPDGGLRFNQVFDNESFTSAEREEIRHILHGCCPHEEHPQDLAGACPSCRSAGGPAWQNQDDLRVECRGCGWEGWADQLLTEPA